MQIFRRNNKGIGIQIFITDCKEISIFGLCFKEDECVLCADLLAGNGERDFMSLEFSLSLIISLFAMFACPTDLFCMILYPKFFYFRISLGVKHQPPKLFVEIFCIRTYLKVSHFQNFLYGLKKKKKNQPPTAFVKTDMHETIIWPST